MESRIEIKPGRTINVTIHENPHPRAVVFLIHGLGGRSEQWREQIPLLKNNYTLVLPDLYGHQKSDAPEPQGGSNPYAFDEIYKDLDALFLRYSGKDNIIFGHSYGGAFATALCYNHQNQVSQLVLIAPTPCVPSIQIPSIYRLPTVALEILRPILEKQFTKLAFNQTKDQYLVSYEVRASRSNPIYLIKGLIKGMATIPSLDMQQLKTPTLLIIGMNDLLVLPALQEQYYRSIPNLTVEKIPNAAHLVMLESASLVNTTINKFLENRYAVV